MEINVRKRYKQYRKNLKTENKVKGKKPKPKHNNPKSIKKKITNPYYIPHGIHSYKATRNYFKTDKAYKEYLKRLRRVHKKNM